MLLVYLVFVMVVIHFSGTILSFLKRTFPRSIGTLIAIYEMVFYFLLVFSPLYNEIIKLIAYVYLIIHVVGGIAYLRGTLSRMYSPERLKYYGIYELIEFIYLFFFIINLVL